MVSMRLLSSLTGALVALMLIGAPAASADAFLDVFTVYQKTGRVDGCKLSAKKLASAKKAVPPDIEQYAPDFPAALDAALAQRTSGACKKSAAPSGAATPAAPVAPPSAGGTPSPPPAPAAPAGSPAAPAPAATPSTPGITPQPAGDVAPAAAASDAAIASAERARAQDDTTPAPLVGLLVLLALCALAGALVAAVRFFAFDPPWMARGRHATAEAGWRTSAAWAEFTDWLRLGR